MNLKEYKERQEAKAYFRGQSSYYLDNTTLIKNLLISLGIGIVVGILYMVIEMILPINFSIFIVAVGYVVSYLIQQVVNHRNVQMAVIAVLATLVAIIFSNFAAMMYALHGVIPFYQMIVPSITMTFSNVITDLYIIVSCVLAYKMND